MITRRNAIWQTTISGLVALAGSAAPSRAQAASTSPLLRGYVWVTAVGNYPVGGPKAGTFLAYFDWTTVVDPAGPWSDLGFAPPEPGLSFDNVISVVNTVGRDPDKHVDLPVDAIPEDIGALVVYAAMMLIGERLNRVGSVTWPLTGISLVFLGITMPQRP